jgi:hypothetical protein
VSVCVEAIIDPLEKMILKKAKSVPSGIVEANMVGNDEMIGCGVEGSERDQEMMRSGVRAVLAILRLSEGHSINRNYPNYFLRS